jgi:dTDP-4-amino-4,6-dideoxygalactose transaminase
VAMKQVLIPEMPIYRELKRYLKQIENSRIYSNFGPLYKELVSRLADLWDLRDENICILANGTLALEGAIAMCEAEPGPWICPSWSFTATGVALRNQNREFSFADVDESWRVAPNTLRGLSGIMDVAPFGDDLDVNRFQAFSGVHIVDAAASFDALCRFKPFPTSSNVGVVLSLHATKLLGAGEGGVFISRNIEWVTRVKSWSSFGFVSSGRESVQEGTNAKISEYSAAVALASLDSWPKRRERMLEIQDELRSISLSSGLKVHPAMEKGYVTPYWIVHSTPKQISKLANLLLARGFETRNWWGLGMHKMKLFADITCESLENTENLAKSTLGLPFHNFLFKSDMKTIKKAFIELFA